ncbi:hypothetical protein NP493_134g03014 [Ridgeia piscesae]|uniref:DH domain-containing protein n=1 Tax=Ridgeia piscesae TaxID=27915 RepID=A0AAD9UGB1_RIDPI|nr:hypothetical protein NP493_134g03014 [Ridgeia piscesae]
MMNVHDSSCKDQMATCTKHVRRLHAQSSVKERSRRISNSLPGASGGTHLRASQSFMERRTVSVPSKASLQGSLSAGVLPRTASGKVIDEDESQEKKKDEDTTNQLLPTEPSNMTDGMSVSMESLDEGAVCVFPGSGDTAELEDDPDLALLAEEAEAWSVTVDKKTLRKMSAKDIKRQDHIWEFVQTEKSHCRTLKIMQRILAHGMLNEAGLTKDMVDRIFPKLDTLLDIHLTFLRRLTERQRLHSDKSIDEIGDVFVQQFKGDMGERMKTAYGEFCSRHNESVQLYKDILKSDRKFQNFIKKCSRNSLCKRKGVPECILLVTQRMTKYPLLIEPIIKTTKDTRMDSKLLEQALLLARDILNSVDRQVDAREKEHELIEIYNKLDARSSALYKSKKFKKSDLLSNNRKLVHQGYIKWMTARGKPFEVLAVILSDVIFFLSENNQKYTFFSQDNKVGLEKDSMFSELKFSCSKVDL